MCIAITLEDYNKIEEILFNRTNLKEFLSQVNIRYDSVLENQNVSEDKRNEIINDKKWINETLKERDKYAGISGWTGLSQRRDENKEFLIDKNVSKNSRTLALILALWDDLINIEKAKELSIDIGIFKTIRININFYNINSFFVE